MAFCLCSAAAIYANDEAKKVNASLGEATVFFNGAELVHKASSAVTKGVNDIWITDLSPNIDVNSLKISTTKGVIVASYEYSLDYINQKAVSAIEKSLKDSVKYYENQILEIDVNDKTNQEVIELLNANKAIAGSQTGLSVAELAKMVDYYTSKATELYKLSKELKVKKDKAKEALDRIEAQLAQESAKNIKAVGVLKLSLTSPTTTTTDFVVTYFTKNASWIPYYDINVSGADEQIQIASKAKVAQTTGLDWTKVKLALSTATPSVNKEAPLFNAWFLDYTYNSSMARRLSGAVPGVAVQNSYAYDDANEELNRVRGELMMEMNEVVDLQPEVDRLRNQLANRNNKNGYAVRSAPGTTSQKQPIYMLNGEVISKAEYDQIPSNMVETTTKLSGQEAQSYGDIASGGIVAVTTKGLQDFVKRDEGELNNVYNIDLPYTILGNGKVQSIDLQSYSVLADFKHYSVPKLDKEVFMLAEIADWQKLGLLSGKANVTFDGTYIGETVINAASVMSKLTLTLGVDKRVTVKREKLQDFSSKKFLGNNVKQELAYKITVKNNRNKAIKMVLKDQYPLSTQKDIEVELLKDITPTTSVNEAVGVWVWEFDLPAGESKEIKDGYIVKYPKDSSINL